MGTAALSFEHLVLVVELLLEVVPFRVVRRELRISSQTFAGPRD